MRRTHVFAARARRTSHVHRVLSKWRHHLKASAWPRMISPMLSKMFDAI